MPKTIAVAGCTRHIGTTTQALQAVKALIEAGFPTCYTEMNRTGYLRNLVRLYANANDKNDLVTFSGVTMYKRTHAKSMTRSGYEYIVRDYGAADEDTFEEASYAEQEIRIVVCGSKPNEIFKTQDLLINPIYDDAFFIFSFVPQDEQASILTLMGERADRTFFADLITDPFVLNQKSNTVFQKIINLK